MPSLNVTQIIDTIRGILKDKALPYSYPTPDIVKYLNQTVEQISVDTLCFKHSMATGKVTWTDLTIVGTTKTITTVAGNWFLYGFAKNDVITISGAVNSTNNGSKTILDIDDDGKVLTVGETMANGSGGSVTLLKSSAPCRIVVAANTNNYKLDERIISIDKESVRVESNGFPLAYSWKNSIVNFDPLWLTSTSNCPTYYILDYEPNFITLYPTPTVADAIVFTSCCRPFKEIGSGERDYYIELPYNFHVDIVSGVISNMALVADLDAFDKDIIGAHVNKYKILKNDIRSYMNKSIPQPNVAYPYAGAL